MDQFTLTLNKQKSNNYNYDFEIDKPNFKECDDTKNFPQYKWESLSINSEEYEKRHPKAFTSTLYLQQKNKGQSFKNGV